MAFFDEIGKRVSEAGQKTMRKTNDMMDTARINSQITDEEKKLNTFYNQLGKLFYLKHKDERDLELSYAELVNFITESENKISTYKKQIQTIKGMQKCSSCGAEVPKDAAFCIACGAAIVKEQEINMTDYVRCRNCNKLVKRTTRFCTTCGTPVILEDISATNEDINENTIICSRCGEQLKEGMKFCTVCGTAIEDIEEGKDISNTTGKSISVCPACGEKIEEGMAFCTKCGTKLEQ